MLGHSFCRDNRVRRRIFGIVEQVPFVEERRPDQRQRRRLLGRIATVGQAAQQVAVGDIVAKEVVPLPSREGRKESLHAFQNVLCVRRGGVRPDSAG
jgi:hypothetical protein